MIRSSRSLALALALLAAPAALAAQQAPATGQPVEIQGLLTELQGIHVQLQALQERALQDSALMAAQEALGASIKAAMAAADPTLEQEMARMQTLEAEFLTAQQANDTTTQTLSAGLYQVVFRDYKVGLGASYAVVILVMVIAVATLFVRYIDRMQQRQGRG